MRAQIEAEIRAPLHKDVRLAALGEDIDEILRDVRVGKDNLLVDVGLAIQDKDEVGGIVQSMLDKEAQILARKVDLVVGVGNQRALLLRRVHVLKSAGIGTSGILRLQQRRRRGGDDRGGAFLRIALCVSRLPAKRGKRGVQAHTVELRKT